MPPEPHPPQITVDTPSGAILIHSAPGVQLSLTGRDRPVVEARWDAGAEGTIELEAPLGAAVGLWHPGMREMRTLPPDWSSATTTSLVKSAPVVVLYDAAGTALWGIAASQVIAEVEMRGGISEERKCIRLRLSLTTADAGSVQIAIWPTPTPLPTMVDAMGDWLRTVNEIHLGPIPNRANEPVYSTWYTYTQEVTEARVLAEGALAAELGCATMFIDDGWQAGAHGRGYGGCGDWVPDRAKFPDLAGTVAALRGHQMETVLWIAPLLLGHESQAHEQLRRFAPWEMVGQHCQVLDPRHPEVREFVAATCARLVADYGLVGLKIDFLNDAMAYAGTPSAGDLTDVGEAMRQMLAAVRARLAAAGLTDPIIEFRQPYVSPAITAFGNCIRVGDCPADAVINRAGGLDLRLWVRGASVHADPLMWAPEAGANAVAQQFASTFFTVPQVSMPLASLDAEQRAAVAHQVRLWRAWREVALFGDLQVNGVELGYTQVTCRRLGRAVVANYRPEPISVAEASRDGETEVLILNATLDSRVVLRATFGWTVAEIRDAAGNPHRVCVLGDDLVDLAIPVFGSARLIRAR